MAASGAAARIARSTSLLLLPVVTTLHCYCWLSFPPRLAWPTCSGTALDSCYSTTTDRTDRGPLMFLDRQPPMQCRQA
jgi:hypothetical protein